MKLQHLLHSRIYQGELGYLQDGVLGERERATGNSTEEDPGKGAEDREARRWMVVVDRLSRMEAWKDSRC